MNLDVHSKTEISDALQCTECNGQCFVLLVTSLATAMRRSKSEIQRWVQPSLSLQILLANSQIMPIFWIRTRKDGRRKSGPAAKHKLSTDTKMCINTSYTSICVCTFIGACMSLRGRISNLLEEKIGKEKHACFLLVLVFCFTPLGADRYRPVAYQHLIFARKHI